MPPPTPFECILIFFNVPQIWFKLFEKDLFDALVAVQSLSTVEPVSVISPMLVVHALHVVLS